jgi:hypothetical protein
LTPLALLGFVLLLTFRSWVTAVVLLAVGFVIWRFFGRQDAHGQSAALGAMDSVRWWVEKRTTGGVFTPHDALDDDDQVVRVLPAEVGACESIAWAPPSRPDAVLGFLVHGEDDERYLTAALEVLGDGDGLRDIWEDNRQGHRFGTFLYGLSRPDLPVDRVDLSTRVLPVDPEEHRGWLAEHLNPAAPIMLQESMWELAEQAGWSGERYRTFLTIRMPRSALLARARLLTGVGQVEEDDVYAAAFDTVGQVSRDAANVGGLKVRAGLGPRALGALIRHTWCPSWLPDDYSGIATALDGFMPYAAERTHVAAGTTEAEHWCHAVASVPKDGWPMTGVPYRWLEWLVTDVHPPVVRTITSQFPLMAKAEARRTAFVALTLDKATEEEGTRKGRVSTGEDEAQSTSSARTLADLIGPAAGTRPALRLLISARTSAQLAIDRERVAAAALEAGLNRLHWHDTRHHHAMLLHLPMARGIR